MNQQMTLMLTHYVPWRMPFRILQVRNKCSCHHSLSLSIFSVFSSPAFTGFSPFLNFFPHFFLFLFCVPLRVSSLDIFWGSSPSLCLVLELASIVSELIFFWYCCFLVAEICWFKVGCLTPNPLLGIAGKINHMSCVVFFIMHDRLCSNYIS